MHPHVQGSTASRPSLSVPTTGRCAGVDVAGRSDPNIRAACCESALCTASWRCGNARQVVLRHIAVADEAAAWDAAALPALQVPTCPEQPSLRPVIPGTGCRQTRLR